MANQTGRPVAPARKLVAAVLGTFAVFVMVFGLGLSSWPIVALGAALLALAIALGMVNVVRRGARAWVTGHGQVKAISDPPPSGAYGRAELQLVVVAPGLPVTEVLVRDPRVPIGKWPRVNETLPISVDVDDMRRCKIEWGDVEDRSDDGDPPPPAPAEPLEEFLDDDLLGEPEPPPWVNRDRSWGRGPDEPMSPAAAPVATEERPGTTVVVHETPAGVVLEGEYVDHDDNPQVLPQRAARRPHHAEPHATAVPLVDDDPLTDDPLLSDPPPADAPPHRDDPSYAEAPPRPSTPADAPPRPDAPSPAEASPRLHDPDDPTIDPRAAGPAPWRTAPEPRRAESDVPPWAEAPPRQTEAEESGVGAADLTDPDTTHRSRAEAPPRSDRAEADSPPDPETDIPLEPEDVPKPESSRPTPHQRTAFYEQPPEPRPARSSYTPVTDQTHPAYQPVQESPSAAAAEPPTAASDTPQSPTATSDLESDRRRPSPRPRKPSEPLPGTSTQSAETPPPPPAGVVPEQRTAYDPDIDLPLDDSDLQPPPEFAPEARRSLDNDLIAPPVDAPEEPRSWAAGATPATPPTEIPISKRPPSTPEDQVTPPEQTAAAAAADRAAATGDTSPRPWEASRIPHEPPPAPTSNVAASRPWETSRTPGPRVAGSTPESSRPVDPAATRSEPLADEPLLEDPLLDDLLDDPGPPPWEVRRAAAEAADPTDRPTISGVDTTPDSPPEPGPTTQSAPPAPSHTPTGSAPAPSHTPTGSAPAPGHTSAGAAPTPGPATTSGAPATGPTTPSTPEARTTSTATSRPEASATSASEPTSADTPRETGAGPVIGAAAAAGVASAAATNVRSSNAQQESRASAEPITSPADPKTTDPSPANSPNAANPASPANSANSASAAGEADSPKPVVVSATARPAARNTRPWSDLEGSGYEPSERTEEVITAYPSARPGPAGAIHGVGITVLVTNMDRSIDFYRDTLGFFQIDTGTGSAVLASGDTRLVLRAVHSLSPDIGRLIYLNLEVGDVDAVYEELKTKGVKFLHGPRPVNRGDKLELWAATFYDPDGHNIAITQWRAIR
ncbi:VOC family protein [Actinoplanes sp. NPDC051470]|uniref:VOC family protein n=1 Tax=Actinoplanes sp. NPDC051470 TaxID=3157224 RepID=UPI0034429E6E